MSDLLRLLRTARHLGMRQVATRVQRAVERRWWRFRQATPAAPLVRPRAHRALWGALPEERLALARAAEILAGNFTFLGETRPCSWDAGGASHLWRFHLHYFDFVRDLAVFAEHRDRAAAFTAFRHLVGSWIDTQTIPGGDAWHPYTISLRIVNWCEGALVFGPELERDSAWSVRLQQSIAAQAEFLSRHLEHDIRGNHLLENARGLLRAAAFFEGPAAEEWRRKGLALLEEELPEQVLADGGHFERAPGYHLRVLEGLTDIAALERAPWIEGPLTRMHAFLRAILPHNGRLPLLKDTVLPERGALAAAAGPQPSQWLAASGYAVIRDDARGDHLIADFGRVCPDYLPAHAHADLFSYELTIGNRPVVVDSGVFEYAEGEWRSWFRSTAAHNTMEVGGRDQSEMWGSFRVGRRARILRTAWRETAALTSIDGTHDGYAPRLHRRVIAALHEPRLWIVLDHLSGSGEGASRSLIHLHPEQEQLAFTPFGPVTVSETTGWYSEQFGVKQANRVIVLTATTPGWSGYVIAAQGAVPRISTGELGHTLTIDIATEAWQGMLRVGSDVTLESGSLS